MYKCSDGTVVFKFKSWTKHLYHSQWIVIILFCQPWKWSPFVALWILPVCFSHSSPFSLSHLFASDSHLSASPSRRPKTANVKMSQILLQPPFSTVFLISPTKHIQRNRCNKKLNETLKTTNTNLTQILLQPSFSLCMSKPNQTKISKINLSHILLLSHFPYLSRIIIVVIKVLIILKTIKNDKDYIKQKQQWQQS